MAAIQAKHSSGLLASISKLFSPPNETTKIWRLLIKRACSSTTSTLYKCNTPYQTCFRREYNDNCDGFSLTFSSSPKGAWLISFL